MTKFPGFPKDPQENYWQYPKALNGWWHQLTGSEQKVLDYILRHTWGYQKIADKISLRQFIVGIRDKDGRLIDRGTGIKHKKTILNAIKRLEEMGFIEVEQEAGKPKFFRLRVIGGCSKNEHLTPLGCSKSEHPGCSKSEHTIDNITIKNISSKEDIARKTRKASKKEIDEIIQFLKSTMNLKELDGSQQMNRRFASHCLHKFGGVENVKKIIKIASLDKFHRANLTNFRYLYNNAVRIVRAYKEKIRRQKGDTLAYYEQQTKELMKKIKQNHE